MAYLGNPAANRFAATESSTKFSGNGSAVDFTLEHSVGSPEDILVSVDGVVQEPTIAYGIVSGTTLRFTSAPSSNSGNNIFAYYLFRTIGTVTHPATSALSATSGTFTGDVIIGDASAADKKILFDGNAQDFHIGLDDSIDSLTIGKGSTLGTTTSMVIDANGIITKPLQPAFSVKPNGNITNIANTNTVAFATEIFDTNADFASNVFTAPVTGKYQIDVNLGLLQVDSAAAFIGLDVDTSNRHYYVLIDPDFGQDAAYWELHFSGLIDMDGSDTITIKFLQSGGTTQADVEDAHTNFSGYLVA